MALTPDSCIITLKLGLDSGCQSWLLLFWFSQKSPERVKRPEQSYEFRFFTLASSTLLREQDVLKGFTDSRMCPWDNS